MNLEEILNFDLDTLSINVLESLQVVDLLTKGKNN